MSNETKILEPDTEIYSVMEKLAEGYAHDDSEVKRHFFNGACAAIVEMEQRPREILVFPVKNLEQEFNTVTTGGDLPESLNFGWENAIEEANIFYNSAGLHRDTQVLRYLMKHFTIRRISLQADAQSVKTTGGELPETKELRGVIFKYSGGDWGPVAVHTNTGDYAIIKNDWDWALEHIGETVTVKMCKDIYKTVEILTAKGGKSRLSI